MLPTVPYYAVSVNKSDKNQFKERKNKMKKPAKPTNNPTNSNNQLVSLQKYLAHTYH